VNNNVQNVCPTHVREYPTFAIHPKCATSEANQLANLIILGRHRSTQRNKMKYTIKGTNDNGKEIKLCDHIDFCWVCGIQDFKNVLLMGMKDPLLVG
jgi:hypothetical protein